MTEPQTLTLAAFLLARIDEDEADARTALQGFTTGHWTSDGGIYAGHPTDEVVDWVYNQARGHIARWDPARVLAECEAKRKIVEALTPATVNGFSMFPATVLEQRILRLLAQSYADHPDYRADEWRP